MRRHATWSERRPKDPVRRDGPTIFPLPPVGMISFPIEEGP